MQRSTTSSSLILRGVMPLRGAVLGDQLLGHRVGDRVALAGLVAVPAGAGLLAEAPRLAQLVGHDRRAWHAGLGRLALARGPADVQAGEVAHAERAHRHAELLQRAVDLLRQRAGVEQALGRGAVARQHAVADEAVADARDHGDLLDLLGQRHAGGQHVGRGLRAAHHFQQPHHVGRAEEVQADHVLRALGERGDLVDVEVRGVGGQDRTGLADFVERAEDLLLDVHVLEHRLDHEVGVGQVVVVERRRDQAPCAARPARRVSLPFFAEFS